MAITSLRGQEASKALSHHYMEYLMDHGGKSAADEFMKLDREVNGYVSSKNIDLTLSKPAAEKCKNKSKGAHEYIGKVGGISF